MTTRKQAVKQESELRKIGRALYYRRMQFRTALRKFKQSGAWAITKEHHTTFKRWCVWFAPQIQLHISTLMTYSNPKHEDHIASGCHMTVSGPSCKWLKHAIRIAHQLGVKERGDGRYAAAITEISRFYLKGKHDLQNLR